MLRYSSAEFIPSHSDKSRDIRSIVWSIICHETPIVVQGVPRAPSRGTGAGSPDDAQEQAVLLRLGPLSSRRGGGRLLQARVPEPGGVQERRSRDLHRRQGPRRPRTGAFPGTGSGHGRKLRAHLLLHPGHPLPDIHQSHRRLGLHSRPQHRGGRLHLQVGEGVLQRKGRAQSRRPSTRSRRSPYSSRGRSGTPTSSSRSRSSSSTASTPL